MASAQEAHVRRHGMKPTEIEPGRGVPNDWDRHLVETWAQRKARRQRERASEGTAHARTGAR